jgi:hypothetical protein
MSAIQPNYLFINTALGAAGITVSEGSVVFGATTNVSPSIKLRNIKNLFTATGRAAVARVQTVTVTAPAAVGTDYSFQITQFIGSSYQTVFVSYESVAGDTAITVATALASVASTLISSGSIQLASADNSGTNVVTLTGSSSNPLFSAEVLEAGSGLVVATTGGGGNEASGIGSDLIAEGITGISDQPVSGNTYNLLLVNYSTDTEDLNAQARSVSGQLYVYYVTDAAFTTAIGTKLSAITLEANAGPAASVERL